ncbi:Bro-N domain-containing protein [Blautia sp. OF09-25XD]|uniref:BRO-N domain-containing protein n=1 Tax=Blautia sp. OF09-25XD TaxID=2292981 RepID=UPI0026C7EE77
MNELKVFNSEEFGDVRTVTINGDPWFVGKDVAAALGFTNPRDAISTHVFDEDKGVESIDTLGGKQKMTVINESGLYALVFGSRLKSAQRFKHWVTSEVLPAIRRTGGYQVPALQGKELLALAVLEAQKTIDEQSKAIERMKPR